MLGFFHFSIFANFGGKLLFSQHSKLLKFSKFHIFFVFFQRKIGFWACLDVCSTPSERQPSIVRDNKVSATFQFFRFLKRKNRKSTNSEIRTLKSDIISCDSWDFHKENSGFFDIDLRLRGSFVTTTWPIRFFLHFLNMYSPRPVDCTMFCGSV